MKVYICIIIDKYIQLKILWLKLKNQLNIGSDPICFWPVTIAITRITILIAKQIITMIFNTAVP